MDWLSVGNVGNISGWSAFLLLSAYIVTAFVKGWVNPRNVTETWREAYKEERKLREQYEAGKIALTHEQGEAVLAMVKAMHEVVLGERRGGER